MKKSITVLLVLVLAIQMTMSANTSNLAAGRLFLTDKAFQELFFQHMILDKLDPVLQGQPLAAKEIGDGSPNSNFNIYLDSMKVEPETTSFTIEGDQINFYTEAFEISVHYVGTMKMGNPAAPSNIVNLDIHPYTKKGKVNMTIQFSNDENQKVIANVTEIQVSLPIWTISQSIIDPTSTNTFDIVLPDQQTSIVNDAISQALTYTFSNQLTEMIQKWTKDKQIFSFLSLDCAFSELPFYKNGKAQISSNLFFYNNQKTKVRPPIPAPAQLPTIDQHNQDETIIFSQYFFNSLSYALYDSSLLNYVLQSEAVPIQVVLNLTSNGLLEYFPDLVNVVGENKFIDMKFQATDAPSTIIKGKTLFHKGQVATQINGQIRFFERDSSSSQVQTPVLILSAVLQADLDLKIDINQMFLEIVDGSFSDLQFVMGQIDQKKANLKGLKNKLSDLFQQEIPRVNNNLLFNIGVPVAPFANVQFTKSSTEFIDGFIKIFANLVFFEEDKQPFGMFPAMKMRIIPQIFDVIKTLSIDYLDAHVPGFTLPNYDIGHFLGISVSSNDIRLSEFYVDPKATRVFTNDQGELHLATGNFHARVTGTIHAVWQIKIWFIKIRIMTTNVNFDATAKISNFDAAIKMNLDGSQKLQCDPVKITVDWDFNYRFDGGLAADLINFITHHFGFHDHIKSQINSRITEQIHSYVTNDLTNSLQQDNTVKPVGDPTSNLSLDTQLTAAPLITSQFTEIQSSFFFGQTSHFAKPPFALHQMPDFSSSDSGQVGILMHQFIFNSLGYTLFKNDMLKKLLTYQQMLTHAKLNFTTDEIKFAFPKIVKAPFGHGLPIDIHIKAAYVPQLSIDTKSISSQTSVQLDFFVRVPSNDSSNGYNSVNAFTLEAIQSSTFNVTVNNSTLFMGIQAFEFQEVRMIGGEIEPSLMFRFVQNTLNHVFKESLSLLNQGFFNDFKIPLNFGKNNFQIENPVVQFGNGYLQILGGANLQMTDQKESFWQNVENHFVKTVISDI